MCRDIVQFIRSRYAVVHEATPPVAYRRFLSRMRSPARGAALGFRRAGDGPLFLEQYLDQPIELALRPYFGDDVERARVVELGSLAANSGLAMIELWLATAQELAAGADIGVAVLTRPLRDMFGRLGIGLHQLGPAHAARLGDAANEWGSYYDNDPVVCAGSLREGQRRLQRFTARRRQPEDAL
jgi:hypothetical protein